MKSGTRGVRRGARFNGASLAVAMGAFGFAGLTPLPAAGKGMEAKRSADQPEEWPYGEY